MIGRLLLMLILAAVFVPQAKGQQSCKKDPCENAQNQQEMNHCAEDEFHKADQKLNKLYNNLGSKLEPERLAKLKEAERAWVKFRDADCDFVTYINKGGSIYPLVYFGCLTESTNDKAARADAQGREPEMKALTGIKLPCFDRPYLGSNDTLQVSAVSGGMPKLSSASRSKMIGFTGSKFPSISLGCIPEPSSTHRRTRACTSGFVNTLVEAYEMIPGRDPNNS